MKDFINNLKTYENMFIQNFTFYDSRECKHKQYLFSPDQNHMYIQVDKIKNKNNMFRCEIGSLYITEKDTFEDTPYQSFDISSDTKKEYEYYIRNKKKWCNSKIHEIKSIFSDKNLII